LHIYARVCVCPRTRAHAKNKPEDSDRKRFIPDRHLSPDAAAFEQVVLKQF
jgi:hypothetical protein